MVKRKMKVREYFGISTPHGNEEFDFVVDKDGKRESVQYKDYKGELDDRTIRFVGECVDCKTLTVKKVLYLD